MIFVANGVIPEIANGTANIAADVSNGLQRSGKQYPTMELPADAADDWALHETVTAIDKRDAATPDSWVPRHPSLIRLTGRYGTLSLTP